MSRFFIASTALFAFAVSGIFQADDLAAHQQQQQQQQQQQAQDSITGTITGMDDNEVTVRTDDQRSMTVRVDQETRILDERGERVQTRAGNLLGDLDSGDRVVVHYRAQGSEHIAVSIEMWSANRQQTRDAGQDPQRQGQQQMPMQNSITGTITGVTENGLTVRTENQQSTTVRVDGQTRILDERGQRVEARAGNLLGDLASGDRVVVNLRTGTDAGERIAASIEMRAADQQQQAQQQQARQPQAQQQAQQQRQEQQFQRQDELPRTSSALPLIAALGLLGLAGAGALSVVARREH